METCHAFELAGAKTERMHINALIENPAALDDFQVLALPGGFSYGDDIAAGKILANQLVHHIRDAAERFIAAGKLVIGICNGFQVLIKSGILPGLVPLSDPTGRAQATIAHNDSGKFEDRWVYLAPGTSNCVFVDTDRRIYLPVAHGEGKVCFADDTVAQAIQANGQIAYRYVDAEGNFGDFPVNPNGSTDHIAGLCDPTGHVLGLMPHPERFVHRTQHPRWTREAIGEPDGLGLFKNAVAYFA